VGQVHPPPSSFIHSRSPQQWRKGQPRALPTLRSWRAASSYCVVPCIGDASLRAVKWEVSTRAALPCTRHNAQSHNKNAHKSPPSLTPSYSYHHQPCRPLPPSPSSSWWAPGCSLCSSRGPPPPSSLPSPPPCLPGSSFGCCARAFFTSGSSAFDGG